MKDVNTANELLMRGAQEAASSAVEEKRRELKEENQKRKRRLVKLGSIMIMIMIILVFATRSWFTMSSEVEGSRAQMTADDLPFELEVRGTKIENASAFPTVDNSFISGIQQEDGEGALISAYQTSGDETHGAIMWNKNSSTNGSYPNGLEPNAHGTLTFWVVPKQSGSLNVYFNFLIRGFHGKYTQDDAHTLIDTIEITDELDSMTSEQLAAYGLTADKISTKKKALEYINGHILFFKNYSNGHYSGFLGNAGNKIAFEDCLPDGTDSVTAGQKYEVTIYWKWANTLEQAVSYSDSPLLSSSDENYADDRSAILTYLADSTRHKIFEGVSASVITTNIAKLQNNISTDDKEALSALTDKFNNADEIIGNNLNFIILEMVTSSS